MSPVARNLLDELRGPNGLNAIRLALAGMVLVGHSWPLSGNGGAPSIFGTDPGTIAVLGFFAISGYLVTGSRLRLSLPRFLWHRFLRIYPGYWAVLTVTAFGFAPLISWTQHEEWTLPAALDYLRRSFTTKTHQFQLHGTLQHADYLGSRSGGPWNGSTWTLYYEVCCYLIVAAVLTLPWARKAWLAAAGLVTASLVMSVDIGIQSWELVTLFSLATPFAAGAFLRLAGRRVPLRADLALISGACLLSALWMHRLYLLGSLPLAYLLLWCGAHWRTRLGSRSDLSYGVYIYAFPVQMMLSDADLATSDPWLFTATTTALVVPLAALSWRLVERPSLRLKNWTPRRPRTRSTVVDRQVTRLGVEQDPSSLDSVTTLSNRTSACSSP